MFRNLLKISAPKRGLKEDIWKKIQAQSGYASAPLLRPLIFQPAFLVLLLVLFSGFGTGVYAHQSPAVQEGHILQPIKRGLETIQVRLARAPEAQARIRLQLAERRLKEVEYKKGQGQFNERTFNQVSIEIRQAEQLVPTIKNLKKREALSNHLDRVRVLRTRGGQDLIKIKPQLDSGRSTPLTPSKEKPQINYNSSANEKNKFACGAICKPSLGSPLLAGPGHKLNNGQRLNYLDYQVNPNKESKPKVKYDHKQQNIRSEPSSLHNARSIRKSSRSIKANKISKESVAKNWSRN